MQSAHAGLQNCTRLPLPADPFWNVLTFEQEQAVVLLQTSNKASDGTAPSASDAERGKLLPARACLSFGKSLVNSSVAAAIVMSRTQSIFC